MAMTGQSKTLYEALRRGNDLPPFDYIDPPFNFNDPWVAKYPSDVTGYYLLEGLRRRFGWESFEGRRLLDFGCGARFARTIHNLNLPFGLYASVDLNVEAITWLQQHLPEPRFRFAHLNAANRLYNPKGTSNSQDDLVKLDLAPCEAACMFSVVTHQAPEEASITFAQIRRVIPEGGQLYLTAFLDDAAGTSYEAEPESPGRVVKYHPRTLLALLEKEGWSASAIYPKNNLQQDAIVCRAI